jgi:hypothetical protein
MKRFNGTAIKKDVNNPTPVGNTPAVGVDVYVKLNSSGTLATIYSDNGVTPIVQPMTTGANGQFSFYAANERYNIEYSLPSGTLVVLDELLYDPDDDPNKGQNNTASNLGVGVGLFAQKNGVDLEFKSIEAGSNITLTSTSTGVTIDAASGGSGEVNTASNSGSGEGLALAKVGSDLPFKTITPGANITLTPSATEIQISSSASTSFVKTDISTSTNLVVDGNYYSSATASHAIPAHGSGSVGDTILITWKIGTIMTLTSASNIKIKFDTTEVTDTSWVFNNYVRQLTITNSGAGWEVK